jgi:Leucine Rich Repeat (LRR) protein
MESDMSSIIKRSAGQETMSQVFALARNEKKQEAISALNTPGNGIPKVLRRQIERDIQENTNTESLNGLEQKHIALLGSPKEHVLGDVNYLKPICSNLGIKDLAVVARVNRSFQLVTREILPIRKFLREGHMLFPKIFSYLSRKKLATTIPLVSHAASESVPNAHRAQLQKKKAITIDEIKFSQKLLKLQADDFAGVLVWCSNLKTFNVMNSENYILEELKEISKCFKQYCPKLNKLYDSSGTSGTPKKIEIITFILEQHPNLTNLALWCNQIRAKALSKILDRGSNLLTLDLLFCEKLQFSDALVLNLPSTLTSLNLSGNKKITDKELKKIGLQCPHLKVLNLSWCEKITRQGLIANALGNFIYLRSLIAIGLRVSDRDFRTIMQKHASLLSPEKRLDLSKERMSAQDMAAYIQKCPSLTSIRIDLMDFTDEDLKILTPHFSKLTALELKGSNISEKQLMTLLEGCPLLTSLYLIGCSNISQEYRDEIRVKYPHLIIQ